MDEVLAALRSNAFALFGVPVTWAEIFGDVTGLWCVWWVARQNVWSWPIGIVNNAFFFLLFWTAKLYADAVLQIIFAILGFYGWYTWVFGAGKNVDLPVRKTSKLEAAIFAAATLFGTYLAMRVLSTQTDSPVPLWDAAVLVLSLIATYGQAKKLLESWWVWIAVDVISVPLYISRGLYPTALLYFIFLCLCIVGLRDWRRSYDAEARA